MSAGKELAPMGDLLLKDYMPRTTLVTEEDTVKVLRFPAIDAHNHHGFRSGASGEPTGGEGIRGIEDVDRLVEVMDQCGIKAMANLTACWGDDLNRLLDHYERRYPRRFYAFDNVDWSRVNTPGFGQLAAGQLEESVGAGPRVEAFKELGLRLNDASRRLLSLDDERPGPL